MPTAQTPLPDDEDHQSDPSALTTQQLWREIAHLSRYFDTRLGTVETRFDAMDKAIGLLQASADRQPTIAVVANELSALTELVTEKFNGVQRQFGDGKTAIDAALQAAEKSVSKQNENFAEATEKSERSVTKEIDAVKANIAQTTKSTDDKIAALDKRLTEINGHTRGLSDGWGYLVGAIGVFIAIATFLISLK